MTIALAGLLCLALIGLFGRARARGLAPDAPMPFEYRKRSGRVALGSLALALTLVVGSFALWTLLLAHLAHVQRPYRPWFSALPLLAVDDRGPRYNHADFWWLAQAVALLETFGLCALFVVLRKRALDRRVWVLLGTAFVAMTAVALASPAVSSFDMYAYAGDAHVGLARGYAPPAAAFSGDWALVNRLYGTPIVPSAYGPVWLVLACAATHFATSLGGALVMLRIVGVLALVVCVGSLARLGVRPHVLALFALNPALFANFVMDGHNDIVAVACVLAAAAIRPRSWLLAIALAACAGAIKLPFVAIAPLAFVCEPTRLRRLWLGAAAAVGGIAISLAFGGAGYLAALHATATIYRATVADPSTNLLRVALVAFTLAGVGYALATRRFVPTLSWAFVALAISLFGWYLAWGIPYAVAERRWLAAYLISLPQFNYAMLTIFADSFPKVLVFDLTFLLAPAIAYVAVRSRRTHAPTFSLTT